MKTFGPLTSFFLLLLWFSPSSAQPPAANLSLWLRSDSGVVLSGSNVAEWHDLSGHSQIFYPNTTLPLFVDTVAALARYPVIHFDGVGDMLATDSLTDIGTVFIVSNWDAGNTFPTYNGLLNRKGPGPAPYIFTAISGTNFYTGGGTLFNGNLFSNSASTISYAPLPQYKVTTGIAGSVVTGYGLFIGFNPIDGGIWSGNVAEILAYSAILTSTERQQVEDYLYNKYAPAVSLGPDIIMTGICDTTLKAQPYFVSYSWNGGPSGADSTFQVSAPGTYRVTATDIFGRPSSDTITVSYPFNQLTDTMLCADDTIVWNTGLNGPQYTYLWSTGDTADTLAIVSGGTYSVIVTDVVASCSMISAPITVTVDYFPDSVDLGPDVSLCSGNSIGLISWADSVLTYTWDDNTHGSTLAITSIGEYHLTAVDPYGCTALDSIHVTVSGTAPIADFKSDTVCFGTATTFTDLSTYFSPDSAWLWNFGDPTSGSNTDTNQNPTHIFSDALTHTISLTVTSVGGCSATITHTAQAAPIPVANFTSATSCISNPTTFANTSNVFGDPSPTWHWDFGDLSTSADTSDQQNPAPYTYSVLGTYTVTLTVTTSNLCIDVIQHTITVYPSSFCFTPDSISGLAVWLSGNNVVNGLYGVSQWNDISGNFNHFLQNDTNKQPDYIPYNPVLAGNPSLRFDGASPQSLSDELVSSLTTNVGTVFVISNWRGGSAFDNYNGIINRDDSQSYLLTGNGNTSTTIFAGGIFGSNSVYMNSVQTLSYAPLSQYKVTTGVASSVATGYFLEVGNNHADAGPWNGDIAEVIVYNTILTQPERQQVEDYLYNKYAPPVNIGNDIVNSNFCNDTLRAQPYFVSYSWNGAVPITDSTFIVTAPGTYTVTATDIFGRTSTDTVNVTYPLNQLSNSLLCAGDTLVWNTGLSSSQYTFLWSTSETTSSINITAAGTYSVTATNISSNCSCTSAPITVTVDNFPLIADLGNDTNLCSGNTIGLIASAGSVQSYSWNTGATTATIIIDTTGTYTVIVIDINGCSAFDTVHVTVDGIAPTASFSYDTVCFGTATTLIDISSPTDSIRLWNFGDPGSGGNNTSTDSIATHIFSDQGPHLVTLTVTGYGGCMATVSNTVTVHPIPAAGFTAATACQSNATVFTNTTNVFGDPATTWQWDFGDISTSSDTDTVQSPSYIYSTLGSYTVTLIATSSFGCVDSVQQSITVYPINFCFNPNQIAGLQLWLAGNNETNVGGKVTQWTDQSGLGHNFSQSDTSKGPLYISNNLILAGKPCLRFDGFNDEMQGDLLTEVGTVFVLANWNGPSSFTNYNGIITRIT
jgi:PKD repeat protein